MKILLICNVLPPNESATSILLGKLIKPFNQTDCLVDGLTVKTSYSDPKEFNCMGMTIYNADTVLYTPHPMRGLRDFAFAVKNRLELKLSKPQKTIPVYKKRVTDALVKRMRQLPMNEYDAVIAVAAYYDAAEALMRYKKKYGLKAKTALYQVDPLAENKIYIDKNEAELLAYEKNLFESFDRVFTTPIIYKQKKSIGWDIKNVTPLEFPTDFKKEIAPAKNGREEIKCVFTGYLYGDIRDAKYTFELFSKMKNPKIHFYLVGKGQESLVSEYENGALKGRLHYLGEKPAAECDKIIEDADVLVNIGNRVNNQVPSKLFHYIGFGKPILNVVSCEGCPTVPYMEKYRLAFNADEKEDCAEAAKRLEAWLLESYGERMTAEEIATSFEECSPEFVANLIIDKLNGTAE